MKHNRTSAFDYTKEPWDTKFDVLKRTFTDSTQYKLFAHRRRSVRPPRVTFALFVVSMNTFSVSGDVPSKGCIASRIIQRCPNDCRSTLQRPAHTQHRSISRTHGKGNRQADESIRVTTLTGWGQSEKSLDSLAPNGADITRIPYYSFNTLESLKACLAKQAQQPDVVIGWSLGGRVAALLVSERVLKPKLLVIMSSAYSIVPGTGLDNALGGTPGAFAILFKSTPDRARALLAQSIAKHDLNSRVIGRGLQQDNDHDADWYRWLSLGRISGDSMTFLKMPRTLLIYGGSDSLVPVTNGCHYARRIKGATLTVLNECGHAPHLHDSALVFELIGRELAILRVSR